MHDCPQAQPVPPVTQAKKENIQLLRRLFDALCPSSQAQDPWGLTWLVPGRSPSWGVSRHFSPCWKTCERTEMFHGSFSHLSTEPISIPAFSTLLCHLLGIRRFPGVLQQWMGCSHTSAKAGLGSLKHCLRSSGKV